jgi:hypothetical protein
LAVIGPKHRVSGPRRGPSTDRQGTGLEYAYDRAMRLPFPLQWLMLSGLVDTFWETDKVG